MAFALDEIEQQLQRLTNAVVSGNTDEAKQSAHAAIGRGRTTNEILDALLEAVDIVVDLCEIGEFDQNKLSRTETTANDILRIVEDRIADSQSRFNFKVALGPLGLKAGSILSSTLAAVLRSVGFEAISLGKTQTPLELLRNSEELGAALVIPLFSGDGSEGQMELFLREFERGGFKSRFDVITLIPGFTQNLSVPVTVARNSSELISRATEWALKRQRT